MDYLTKRETSCFKGICALLVLVHHFYLRIGPINIGVVDQALEDLGYLAVSIFFFLSGYGLETSVEKKGIDYISNFPRKRLLPFYFMNLLLVFIYSVWRMLNRESMTTILILKSLTCGGTVIRYGWYIQVQLLLYIAFYGVFRLYKKNRVIIFFAVCLAYSVLAKQLGFRAWWYISSFAFPFGMLWREKQEIISKIAETKMLPIISLVLLLAVYRAPCYNFGQ